MVCMPMQMLLLSWLTSAWNSASDLCNLVYDSVLYNKLLFSFWEFNKYKIPCFLDYVETIK